MGCFRGELATGGRALPERADSRRIHPACHRSADLIPGRGGWEKNGEKRPTDPKSDKEEGVTGLVPSRAALPLARLTSRPKRGTSAGPEGRFFAKFKEGRFHAKVEARESELEAVRLRLTDVEKGWARSRTEADTLRAPTTAGLVSMDEDRITRRVMVRIRAMESEMASLRLSEKSSEAMESRNEG
jgi:hypothetical protein